MPLPTLPAIPRPSLTSMLDSVAIPPGMPGSMFKIPGFDEAVGQVDSAAAKMGALFEAPSELNKDSPTSKLVAGVTGAKDKMTSHLTAKIANLGTELPIMAAVDGVSKKIADIDSMLAGASRAAGTISDAINSSIKSVKDVTTVPGFESLFNAGDTVSALASAAGEVISDSLGPAALGRMSQLLGGPPTSDAAALNALMETASASSLAAMNEALHGSAATVSDKAIATALSTAAGGLMAEGGSVAAAIAGIDSMVESEAATLEAGIAKLKGLNLLTLVASTNPMIAAVINLVGKPALIENPASKILAGAPFELPITQNIKSAMSLDPSAAMTDKLSSLKGAVTVPEPPVNACTPEELVALSNGVNNAEKDQQTAAKALASELERVDSMRSDPSYIAAMEAAGASDSEPDGNTTDRIAQLLWQKKKKEYDDAVSSLKSSPIMAAAEEKSKALKLLQKDKETKTWYGK